MKYDFASIEPKWQKKWQEEKTFATENGGDKPKFYALVEFPYPSGQGLHVGHTRPYTAMPPAHDHGIVIEFSVFYTSHKNLSQTVKIMVLRPFSCVRLPTAR